MLIVYPIGYSCQAGRSRISRANKERFSPRAASVHRWHGRTSLCRAAWGLKCVERSRGGYEYHPHIHFLVTGGGQAPDGSWREPDPGFLVPVWAFSKLARARFRDGLRERLPRVFAAIPSSGWTQAWVVHSKPVGSGEHTLRYLARYIHRVALSNHAIRSADDHQVTFRYRRSEDGKWRTGSVTPREFLRRFLQHVLPKGFVKVRYYGLHHASRRAAIPLLRAALCLRAERPLPPILPPPSNSKAPPGLCPRCRTPMICVQRLAPVRFATNWMSRRPLETSPP